MHKILRLSWLNVKNTIGSKKLLIGLLAAFSYSMLWILFVHPPHYMLDGYDFEFGRFLYVLILYASVSMLRNDIKYNTTKTIFTGIYSRAQIMLSKGIGLIILGIIFSITVEINNIIASLILFKKIGFEGFIHFNHIHLFITYIVITFAMGSVMLLIASLMFSRDKSILFVIVFFSMVNFYTAGLATLILRKPEMAHVFSGYMKTPLYTTVVLMAGEFSNNAVIINIIWAAVMFLGAIIVINRREIK